MINKFKTGFYFEKYETPEEAKAELLKLHPIGSDVEGLVGTLERAGAVEGTPKDKIENGGWDSVYGDAYNKEIKLGTFLLFYYEHRQIPKSIFPRRWNVIIQKKDANILNIFSSFQQGE